MLRRIIQWRHLVLVSLLEGFDYWFNLLSCYWSVQVFYFFIIWSFRYVSRNLLFLLGYPIFGGYLLIVVSYPFYFCHSNCNVSFFISYLFEFSLSFLCLEKSLAILLIFKKILSCVDFLNCLCILYFIYFCLIFIISSFW